MPTAELESPEFGISSLPDGPYEIIDGKPVEKRMGIREVHLTSILALYLGRFVLDRQLGLLESEMLFDFGIEDAPQRRPDIAFISYERWPKGKRLPSTNAFKVVPDLVVEVVSPSNSANEVEGKVMEYLKAGVRLIWVVHPTSARIYVHQDSKTIQVVSRGDDLEGGEILPGFRLPLNSLFEVEEEEV